MRSFPRAKSVSGRRRLLADAARFVALAWMVTLGSCAVQLAPAYNQSIVDGLNGANTQAMTMFATVSAGVTADTFAASRQAQYNSLIGAFSALESQVASRPMPQPPLLGSAATPEAWQKALQNAPTKGSLETIVSIVTKMRDEDSKNGFKAVTTGCQSATLDPSLVCGFQNSYTQNFDSALTYEMALHR